MTGIDDTHRFSREIQRIVDHLQHPTQWRILGLLLSNENELEYCQLEAELLHDTTREEFAHHLRELAKYGWVYSTTNPNFDIDDYEHYRYQISKIAGKLIVGMIHSMNTSSYRTDPFDEIRDLQLEDYRDKYQRMLPIDVSIGGLSSQTSRENNIRNRSSTESSEGDLDRMIINPVFASQPSNKKRGRHY